MINLQKSFAFVYTNSELSEKKFREQSHLCEKNKIPGNKLNQEGERLYNENLKTLKQKINQGINAQTDIQYSGIGRLNSVKYSYYLK